MMNANTEDYIKAIYKLEKSGEKVTNSALARQLRVASASITEMIKKLSKKGYLNYVRYQGVALTARGKRMALGIVRRHRLWEMYLVEHLGYSWDKVHEEAERLEHVTSEMLERKLDKALKHPNIDPHGDPIPTVDGEMKSHVHASLAGCRPGVKVRIRRISDDDPALLQHAARLGLTLNTTLVVKQKLALDGSMVIKIGAKEKFLSEHVAKSIFVQTL
jgi:DtxR family transcriptional regulator, Mn-dependent transcriptional regulator